MPLWQSRNEILIALGVSNNITYAEEVSCSQENIVLNSSLSNQDWTAMALLFRPRQQQQGQLRLTPRRHGLAQCPLASAARTVKQRGAATQQLGQGRATGTRARDRVYTRERELMGARTDTGPSALSCGRVNAVSTVPLIHHHLSN